MRRLDSLPLRQRALLREADTDRDRSARPFQARGIRRYVTIPSGAATGTHARTHIGHASGGSGDRKRARAIICNRRDDRRTYDCTRRCKFTAPRRSFAAAARSVSSRRVAVARRDERKTEQRVFLRASSTRRFSANERNRHDHPPHRPAKRSTGCRAPSEKGRLDSRIVREMEDKSFEKRSEIFFVGFLPRGR